jgi:hypothetical protein
VLPFSLIHLYICYLEMFYWGKKKSIYSGTWGYLHGLIMWFCLCSPLKTKQRFHCVWADLLQLVLNSLSISILSYVVLVRKCWEKPMCLILCLQLRNLVWATSKHDVYFTSHYSIRHWSALSGINTELMNVEGHVAPREVWYVVVFSFSVSDLRSLLPFNLYY